jgi:hypothetical protein
MVAGRPEGMPRLRILKLWPLLAALLLPVNPAAAQQEAAPPEQGPPAGDGGVQQPPRRLLLLFRVDESAAIDSAQAMLLYESLLVKLGRASERVVLVEPGEGPLPATDAERGDTALRMQADSWIEVTVAGSWEQPRIAVRSYDVLRQKQTIELDLQKRIRRGVMELERSFWDEVSAAVRDSYTSGGLAIGKTALRTALTLQAVPGSRVSGFTPRPVRVGDDGQAVAEVELPATFSYRATRLGYYPSEGLVLLQPGEQSLLIAQERGTRWALSLYLYNAAYPGLELAFYPVPGFLFLRLGVTTYLLGLVFGGGSEEQILASYSLSHLNLSAGLYLNEADSMFRFYLAMGLFARVMTPAGLGIRLEPIAPWGLEPVLGMEISRSLKHRFYVEYAPRFYWTWNWTFFWMSMPQDRNPDMMRFPIDAAYAWFWEIFAFRLGMRILL